MASSVKSQPFLARLGSRVTDQPIPPSLDAIILRCLAKAPEESPQTALDVLKALRASSDTPSWTPEDSACWWQERAPIIRTQLKRRDPSSDTTALTVEPGGR